MKHRKWPVGSRIDADPEEYSSAARDTLLGLACGLHLAEDTGQFLTLLLASQVCAELALAHLQHVARC